MSDDFRRRYERMLTRVPRGILAGAEVLALPGNVPPWTRTGLALRAGDRVSLLAAGEVVISEALGIRARPSFCLWRRVGERGHVRGSARDTTTFEAESDGTLHLGILNGEWATPDGRLAGPVDAYATATGGFDVLLLHWGRRSEADVVAALRHLVELEPGDALLRDELARLESPVERPRGWHPHWLIGESDVFSVVADSGQRRIRSHPVDEVAIYRYPVDLPLDASTRLSWRWNVARLPSEVAEDALLTHDYLSIAVELDDGRDLSWFWSASLPTETSFHCPIPAWNARETHLVVRSGTDDLGGWLAEERSVLRDYERAIGSPPDRVVAVWLIAVSLFQHATGDALFADIALHSDTGTVRVTA